MQQNDKQILNAVMAKEITSIEELSEQIGLDPDEIEEVFQGKEEEYARLMHMMDFYANHHCRT